MIQGLLGIKRGQSQYFTPEGKRIPVTSIQAGPCFITRVSMISGSQYIEIAFGSRRHISKALAGHVKKAGIDEKPRFLRQIRQEEAGDFTPGKTILVSDVFTPGDTVRVIGTSKGKGFAGVVKRHGFAGGPRTHGQSDRERAPGSVGSGTTPGRVYRGKRMAGHMGTDRVTQRGLKVIAVDPGTHTLLIKGLVPGAKNGLLLIQKEK
ncbi:MAG: 50S ribosomal protein L3 [bacterium]|nr:50S ribosomal protein L3 [bacterium]